MRQSSLQLHKGGFQRACFRNQEVLQIKHSDEITHRNISNEQIKL